MTRFPLFHRLHLSLLLLPMGLLLACSQTPRGTDAVAEYNANPLAVLIPASVSSEEAEAQAVETLEQRQWIVTDRSPGRISAQLDHRNYVARVTLEQQGNRVVILNESRREPGTRRAAKPAVPLDWLQNLQSDLNNRLVRIAAMRD